MSDKIDRDAVLALLTPAPNAKNGLWAKRMRKLHDQAAALPAARVEDVRAAPAVPVLESLAGLVVRAQNMIPEDRTAWHQAADAAIAAAIAAAPAEDVRAGALREAIQLVGDQAVEILLCHKPDASSILKQATRQGITAPLRALLKEIDGA